MSKRKWTDEQFIEAVKTSLSHAEVMRKLGLKPAGSNYETVKRKISELNLDTSHMTGQAWNQGDRYRPIKGAFSKARKEVHAAENCPIYKEGSGRDLILYYQDPTIEVEKVDNMFMSLQDTYRSYEKELNALKAELKEEVNKLSNTQEQEYREKMAEFKAKYDKYTSELGELRSRFNSWKTSEMERISKLKIALPKNLLDIFEETRRLFL